MIVEVGRGDVEIFRVQIGSCIFSRCNGVEVVEVMVRWSWQWCRGLVEVVEVMVEVGRGDVKKIRVQIGSCIISRCNGVYAMLSRWSWQWSWCMMFKLMYPIFFVLLNCV